MRRKQPRRPLAGGMNQGGSHTRDYYAAMERNGAQSHANPLRHLEDTMLSDRRHTRKFPRGPIPRL